MNKLETRQYQFNKLKEHLEARGYSIRVSRWMEDLASDFDCDSLDVEVWLGDDFRVNISLDYREGAFYLCEDGGYYVVGKVHTLTEDLQPLLGKVTSIANFLLRG